MLKMVIANPMQFAMVSAEPTNCCGALRAFSAENCGESPTTTTPQNTRKARKIGVGAKKTSGEITQHMPEARSCANATGALPALREIKPPATQPMLPAAMTKNAHSDKLSVV